MEDTIPFLQCPFAIKGDRGFLVYTCFHIYPNKRQSKAVKTAKNYDNNLVIISEYIKSFSFNLKITLNFN